MRQLSRYLDPWSLVVLAITLGLFIVALFVKGFTHDLLLEAGVFLVSVKLIIMAFRNSAHAEMMEKELAEIQSKLDRIAGGLR